MIGEIKEKKSQKPKAFPVVGRSGAPTPSVLPSKKNHISEESLHKEGLIHENDLTLENMSQKEIDMAMEEINSLLSTKNIEFLKSTKLDFAINSNMGRTQHNVSVYQHGSLKNDSVKAPNKESINDNIRFDLLGRRIISKSSFLNEVASHLQSLIEASRIQCDTIANLFVDGVLKCDLCYEYVEIPGIQSDLFNHEFSPDSPGYDMREICELYRSDYQQQRSIANRMMQGIFRRRDFCVSYVAYSDAVQSMSTSSNFYSICDNLLAAKIKIDVLQPTKPSKIIMEDLLLRYCCVDKLPAVFPSLLLWSTSIRNSSSNRYDVFKTLLCYLRSEVEWEVQSLLWSGLWGSCGVPSLMTPHSKRLGTMSYEQHFADCLTKANSKPEKQDDNEFGDLNDEFVLRCRWNRVQAFFDNDLIVSLSSHIGLALQLLLNAVTLFTSNEKVNISSINLDFSMGLVCLEIMSTAPSKCDTSVLDFIFIHFVKHCLPIVLQLEEIVNNNIDKLFEVDAVFYFLTHWWTLICELSRWNSKVSFLVFASSQISFVVVGKFTSKYLSKLSIDVHYHHIQWILRTWRVALLYETSNLEMITDLLTSSALNFNALDCISCNLQFSDSLNCDIYALLEQSAVTMASLLLSSFKFDEKSLNQLHQCCNTLLSSGFSVASRLSDETVVCHPLLLANAMHFVASIIGSKWQNNTSEVARSPLSKFCNALFQVDLRGIGLIPALSSQTSSILTVDSFKDLRVQNFSKTVPGGCWHSYELFVAVKRLRSTIMCDNTGNGDYLLPVESSMSSGLFAWQMHRLYQCSELLKLQEIAFVTDCNLFSVFEKSICKFTDSLSGILVLLLSAYLECSLLTSVPLNTLLTEVDDMRNAMLTTVLGITLPSPSLASCRRHSRVGPFGVMLGDKVAGSSYVCQWLNNSYTGQLPLPVDWQYSCLLQLEGRALHGWMIVLEREETTNVDSLGSKAYYLLKLATIENSAKWSTSGDLDLMSRCFVSLLSKLIIQSPNQSEFMPSLLMAAQKQYFSSSSFVTPSNTSSMGSLIDLCGKVLECGLGQYIHADVHVSALSFFLLPLFPVVVRSKVWHQLVELQLVHLLEFDGILGSWINFFTWSKSSSRSEIAYLRTMLSGVCNLRSNDDLQLCIVSVVLFQICQCIFHEGVSSCRSQGGVLLLQLIKNEVNDFNDCLLNIPDVLILNLLFFDANCTVTDFHKRRLLEGPVNEGLLEKTIQFDDDSTQTIRQLLDSFRRNMNVK